MKNNAIAFVSQPNVVVTIPAEISMSKYKYGMNENILCMSVCLSKTIDFCYTQFL